ncbi:hypothetical protein N0V82_001108 [Gnomoniopsis sp. IMI 355080]|nr:hypothetical protein N0V82_001108 [Gnomoniopsis sp. IMI 355080]
MAPRSKRGKLLTCFYCGRRSTTRYDGQIQHFDCPKCNATNFLDALGDITDPPVATTATPDAPTYARRSDSPHLTEQIFCRKCTQNQHLVISSLAQYFPDDPDDPEYPERERAYYRFRRNLEQRYPQCCVECEPKVREQLDKANYTAKTDWLRRKLDYSNETRILLTKTGANYFQATGKWLWNASLFLQLLWHTMLIQKAVINSNEVELTSWSMLAARIFGLFFNRLPTSESVMYWSFWLTILSFWWNPKWVESWRGFIRHLSGFKNYYTYQVMILLLKLPGYLNFTVLHTPRAQRVGIQVIAHTSMALFMFFVYSSARKSIRTDNRKLWLPRPGSILATPSASPAGGAQTEPVQSGEQTMADALDEILHEPTTPKPAVDPQPYMAKFSAPDQFDHMPKSSVRSSYNPSAPSLGPNPFQSTTTTPQRPTTSGSNMGFSSLSLSDQPQTRAQTRSQTQALQPHPPQQIFQQPRPQYQEDMEWTHDTPQHRAFATYQPGKATEKRGFNETPTTTKSGVFWAKIPPKPTTPAQRVFNPPNRPVFRTSPASPLNNPLGFQGSSSTGVSTGSTMFGQHRKQQPPPPPPSNVAPSNTIFAQPSLLLPPPSDERDSLAEAFKQSFSISSGGGGVAGTAGGPKHGGTAQGQDLASKLKYLVLGLCLAVLGNVAYNYFF